MYKLKDKGIDNNLAKSGKSLSQRVVRGGAWVFALRITEGGFGLIRLVILARILAPHDFGLMGIALLTMATLETFSQTGFHVALVQKRDNTEAYLDAAWTVLVLRGFLLFTILFFIAPYAAIFFNSPQTKPIIQVIGLSILLQSFANIGVIYFRKELQFNKQFLYQLSGTLANFAVAVSAALILRSIWALVFGLLAGTIARLIVSYLIHPYRPHFTSDLGKAKELFGFGKWILGSSILVFLITQGDDIFVGKLLGVAALGFYQMAYRISNMPATEITHLISQVTFPAYSKLQDNLPKLREAYLRILQLIASLSFPMAGMIFILAPQFTNIFLGTKWMPMVPAMQALTLWGLIRSLGVTTSPVFLAIGKPRILTSMQFIQVIVLYTSIYPLTIHWNILGTSFAVITSALIMNSIRAYVTIKTLKCKMGDFFSAIFFPSIITLVAIFSVISFRKLIEVTTMFNFFLQIVLFVSIYLGLIYVADKFLGYEIKAIGKEIFSFTPKKARDS